MTNNTLKTAEPTMVPNPTSLSERNVPMREVVSSGAEPPACRVQNCEFVNGMMVGSKRSREERMG